MSKPVKNLISAQYEKEFGGIAGAVVIDIRGIKSNDTNAMRSDLAGKSIKIRVIKNSLARNVFKAGDLAALNDYIQGASAMVYPTSEETSVVGVARELIDWAKKVQALQFRGAVMDGMAFGPDEIDRLSKFPTKEEAQAQVVQIVLTPGQKLAGSILGPGRKLASIVKSIEEKLEKGEEISKVA